MISPPSELPVLFRERIQEIYGTYSDNVLRSFSKSHQKSIRVNTLKASNEEIEHEFTQSSIRFEKAPIMPEAYCIDPSVETAMLIELSAYKDGKFYIQSLSSMLATHVLDPQPEELILDVAAAPGSKTSHIACRMKNKGQIVANDLSWQRLNKLRFILGQMGVKNTTIINFPGQTLWRDYENTFDRVLVDVPCSMEGRIQLVDRDTYSDWSIKRIKELSDKQKGLLRSAIRCAKSGATIIYSTCTLAPEENEEVIDWLLRKEPNVIVEPISINAVKKVSCVTEWEGKNYTQEVQKTLRIVPTAMWEGFYIAKLKKL